MTQLRCAECGETFVERSELALLSPCPACGEDAVEADFEEPEPPEPPSRRDDPNAEARRSASELLVKHGQQAVPVDVEAIASAVGLTVSRAPLGDVDGELRDQRLAVNREHSTVRQRFTIAHELGHLVLHTSHGSDRKIERQAEAFAAALLMPPVLLRQAVAEGDATIQSLSRRFLVSREAMTIELQQHRLINRLAK